MDNSLLFVVGAGIIQAIFLACIIYFHPRSDRSVNRFLMLYILCYCIPMFTPFIQHYFSWQRLLYIDPFLLLIGPFLYLYVLSFKERVTWRKAWPHFLMFGLFIGLDVHMLLNVVNQYPPTEHVPKEFIHSAWAVVRVLMRITQMFVYVIWANRVLTSYQRSIQHLYSETSRIDLAWVRWLINGFLLLTVVMFVLYLAILRAPEHGQFILLINTAIVTPYMYAVTFRGVTQPTLWQARAGVSKETVLEQMHDAEAMDEPESKSQKPALNPERQGDIVARTLAAMENEKLYLKTELSLQDLADRLGIPGYQVSQAINDGLQKTFYDLVNGYRVAEAKRLLQDPKTKNTKILAIAFDSGFNSKTTFNTVFKKFTGQTPTDFRGADGAEA